MGRQVQKMTQVSLIELSHLTKDYGSFRAINNLTLKIDGGITGLLGPNGAGKSTLIKVLLGLVRCTSGTGRVLAGDDCIHKGGIKLLLGHLELRLVRRRYRATLASGQPLASKSARP